ncbi:MAG: phage major capsid protein [Sphingobacteriaceae bacterium]|nr:phage major capsid protein [Sphingobacteriaceae bacterium]
MKKWILFEKDWAQDDNTTFKKGQVIQVDASLAESLVMLKFAKETEAPSSDDIVTKTSEKFAQTVSTIIDSSLNKAFSQFNDTLEKGIKLPATAVDHDLEKMGGFKSQEEFVSCVIKAGRPGGNVDERLVKAPTGQHTQDDQEGGYLVPETIETRIWTKVSDDMELDFFSRATDKRKTSGNTLKFNAQEESSRKDGYRHFGAVAYWTDEAEQFTASKIIWSQRRLELHKLTALYYATDEEMDDAGTALGSVFDVAARRSIMFKLNQGVWNGNGVAKPLGIFSGNNPALISIAKESGQAAATILHQNISKMYHRMHPSMRARANWYVHPNLQEQLEFMYFANDTTNKRPLYMPAGGVSGSPYGSLYGRPVIPCEFCADLGTQTDICFADMTQIITLSKQSGGMKRASSIHVRFLYEETAFRFSFRADAQPVYAKQVEDLNGTTKRSPYITLDTRA